jgi:hypothetical protein
MSVVQYTKVVRSLYTVRHRRNIPYIDTMNHC